MRIGFFGLGKLGLPVAVALSEKGHEVYGYDVDEEKMTLYRHGIPATGEIEPNLRGKLVVALTEDLYLCHSLEEVLSYAPEVVFVAVPTPSLPEGRFDTSYVTEVTQKIVDNLVPDFASPTIVIISTVLPTTIRNEVAPIVEGKCTLIYNPFFIAMGTVIPDFLNPEFILLGTKDGTANPLMVRLYKPVYNGEQQPPSLFMTWENAELTKMLYNTIIGFKIITGNTIMEMADHIPQANCDTIVNAFRHATQRIIGAKYLRGGMGDGGECHPRDNKALEWLSNSLGLSTNPFQYILKARMLQAEWKANLMKHYDLPCVIMGKRFKPNTTLTTDSASILVEHWLSPTREVWYYDPPLGLTDIPDESCVFLASIEESWVREYNYPEGSVVLDVWRQFTEEEAETLKARGVEYVALGRGSSEFHINCEESTCESA